MGFEWWVLFLLGLVVGSFLNVLIYRLPKNLIISGRSFCPSCKRKIPWQDNIPVLSFVMLGGKCRNCHSPISLRYPIAELSTGVLFVLTVFLLPDLNPKSQILNPKYLILVFYHLFIVSSLIVVFFTDLKYGIIPDKIVFPAIAVTFLYLILNTSYLIQNHIFSAIGSFLFFLFLFLVTRGRGMGLGDVKLAILLGLVLGFSKIVVALYIAFLTGAAVSVILVLVGKKRFGQTIAFGPFLILGTIVAWLLYEKILEIFPWFYFG